MKAIQVRAPAGLDTLELADLPDPGEPGPGQVRVELHATSLNFHDYLVVIGGIPAADRRIPMSDGGGVVTAVGEGVSQFKVGDAVISNFFPDWEDGLADQRLLRRVTGDTWDGCARQTMVAEAKAFTAAPKGFSHAEGATLVCAGITAWRALVVEGQLKPGETVVVQGTGGVACFAVQIAKMIGATVIATSSSDAKLERLKAMGADHLINYRSTPEWGLVANEMAGGDGADHVLEIGGPGTLPQSIKATRNGGHISMIGVLTGTVGPVPTVELLSRQIRLIGITVGSHRQMRDFVRAIDANGLRPVIDGSFPLEDLAGAFRHQESGTHFGKIVVEW